MINVTVIGFGNVGSTLSLHLLSNGHTLRLNIMEPDHQCEGAFFDLAHAMPLHPTKELHVNDESLFVDADFIFYTAGIKNEKGDSRLSTTRQNVSLTKEIFEHRVFQKSAFIIVITNPVDVISRAVCKFSGLPAKQVIGTGTYLDSMRLQHYLASMGNCKLSDINAMVVGEHGSSQVPVFSNTTINGEPIIMSDKISSMDLQQAHLLTLNAANKIRDTQDGTRYGVAKCAETILNYLLSEQEQLVCLSLETNDFYRTILKLEKNIFISMPVCVKKGKIEINNEINFSNEELIAFRKSAALLEAMSIE